MFSLDTKKVIVLVKKAEKLQSIIDVKKDINKKRGIKQSRRIRDLVRKRDRIYKKIKNIKVSFVFLEILEDLNI